MTGDDDVIVVGAGPAGAVAATLLARAGARVRLIDRLCFPRDKLCGDTVNPGTLAILRRLGMAGAVEGRGLRVDGMVVTGERGVRVACRYPHDLYGRALVRREMDLALVEHALAAGAQFEPQTVVRRAIVHEGRPLRVAGVVVGVSGSERELRSRVVIAADGRHSTVAFGLGLARHPKRPRRWALGAYFDNVAGLSACGEMHVRRGRYIGVAPVPGGLTNVCLVKAWDPAAGDIPLRDPAAALRRELTRDPALADRFAAARLVAPPVVLGPLAVDVRDAGLDGLFLAGDAAGFIDPMTGDGLRFAVHGAELVARAALQALEQGWPGVHQRIAALRRREFAAKWRFNRTLRALVSSPAAVVAAGTIASFAPGVLRGLVGFAGDCQID
ncbi:MAG: FAD-dependent monooxygenase [Vicinamibacterales bacterium]